MILRVVVCICLWNECVYIFLFVHQRLTFNFPLDVNIATVCTYLSKPYYYSRRMSLTTKEV